MPFFSYFYFLRAYNVKIEFQVPARNERPMGLRQNEMTNGFPDSFRVPLFFLIGLALSLIEKEIC